MTYRVIDLDGCIYSNKDKNFKANHNGQPWLKALVGSNKDKNFKANHNKAETSTQVLMLYL